MDQNEEPAELAQRYLDLWVEHWSAHLTSPETATTVAHWMDILAAFAGRSASAFEAARGLASAGPEPPAFRAAPNDGGERIGQLERRIADLERRLADAERHAGAGMAEPPAKPRRKPRPN